MAKEIINKMERRSMKQEKVPANHVYNKGLISKYVKNSYASTTKQTLQLNNGAEEVNRHFSKDDIKATGT